MGVTEAKGVDLGVGKVERGLIDLNVFGFRFLSNFADIDVEFFLKFLASADEFALFHQMIEVIDVGFFINFFVALAVDCEELVFFDGRSVEEVVGHGLGRGLGDYFIDEFVFLVVFEGDFGCEVGYVL